MNILKYILPSLLLIAACASPEPDSTSFEWIEMDRAQELAEKHDKKILVNVYTDWCEYCKKMDQTVYQDSSIIAALGTYYYAVRLNAESDQIITFNGEPITHSELAGEMGIRSYPTILFLHPDGELILQINGFMPADDFQNMITYIGEDIYQRRDFHEFASGETNR
ncbi:MAG: Thioredoxin-related protein [Bacteroidetes bacterium HLUCCA01]|nr:MAG: Thioredoxin-related protein [Bacteroidetes bacterium HLUCCA01]